MIKMSESNIFNPYPVPKYVEIAFATIIFVTEFLVMREDCLLSFIVSLCVSLAVITSRIMNLHPTKCMTLELY